MSALPQSEWEDRRESVLDRDNSECQFCGMSNAEHEEQNDRGLHIHHIIPKSDGGDDSLTNLIAVCQSCHMTLEHVHGKVVSQSETYQAAENLEKVQKVHKEKMDFINNEIAPEMHKWAVENPVFCREMSFHPESNKESSEVVTYKWDCVPQWVTEGISSEYEFLIAFGYKEGVLDVASELDGQTQMAVNDE